MVSTSSKYIPFKVVVSDFNLHPYTAATTAGFMIALGGVPKSPTMIPAALQPFQSILYPRHEDTAATTAGGNKGDVNPGGKGTRKTCAACAELGGLFGVHLTHEHRRVCKYRKQKLGVAA